LNFEPELKFDQGLNKRKIMKIINWKNGCALVGAVSMMKTPGLFAAIIGTGSIYLTAPNDVATGDVNGPYIIATTTTASGPALGTYDTFCIGTTIDVSPNTTYSYQLGTDVQPYAGGYPGGYSYVSLGTAWLYSQYRAGAIGDHSASGPVNDPVNDDLQAAIWYFQGEDPRISDPNFDPAMNSFVILADGKLGGTVGDNDPGAYGVYALNLYEGGSGTYAQPQLALVPQLSSVPEPSTYGPLAGAGLLLVALRRQLRRNKSA
jgi:hypothetical protein